MRSFSWCPGSCLAVVRVTHRGQGDPVHSVEGTCNRKMKVIRQHKGRDGENLEAQTDGISPAAVNDADKLSFFTVVPNSQFHLAPRPGGRLKGTVERWSRSGRRQYLGNL